MAHLLNTVSSEPVKRGGLYHTESNYNELRSGI
jgi:hypothetical protein